MERLATGIPGLDLVLDGGLPVGSTVIVGGPPGAGKTIVAEQMLFHHAARGRKSLLLTTLSEPHEKLIRRCAEFAWFDRASIGRHIEFLSLYNAVLEGGTASALELVVRAVRERHAELLVLDAFRGVIKTRDSGFDPRVHVYEIDAAGLRIGETLCGVEGTLMGTGRLRTTNPNPTLAAEG